MGGIIGSTRIRGSATEAFYYNQSLLRYCTNTGNISGTRFVGGAIGEAQAGGFSVANTGQVTAQDYAGGIVGTSSLAVVHNSVNGGTVSAQDHAAGIVGKCTWGSLAICQNAGEVKASSGLAGGVAGLVGNNTVIHYCSNFAPVAGGNSWTGGIVGDVGEPREWTGLDIAECVIGSLECVMAFAGPTLAIVEGATELAHAVEITIKIVETAADMALQSADYVLIGFSIKEIVSPETEAAIQADMHAKSDDINQENIGLIASLHGNCNAADCPVYPGNGLGQKLMTNVGSLLDWYNIEGNDEIFNEIINEKREARAEELEEIEKTKEIVHTVIAGVAVATSTIALLAGEVATGGAATALIAVGAYASIVGGLNAVIKSCTKFETNAVIISQCVNGSTVTAANKGHVGSIAGRLCDGSLIYDCLNAVADNNHEEFAADFNTMCSATHCISLIEHPLFSTDGELENCVFVTTDPRNDQISSEGMTFVSTNGMSASGTFSKLGFSIGDSGRWKIMAGVPFPIPNYSEMQK